MNIVTYIYLSKPFLYIKMSNILWIKWSSIFFWNSKKYIFENRGSLVLCWSFNYSCFQKITCFERISSHGSYIGTMLFVVVCFCFYLMMASKWNDQLTYDIGVNDTETLIWIWHASQSIVTRWHDTFKDFLTISIKTNFLMVFNKNSKQENNLKQVIQSIYAL